SENPLFTDFITSDQPFYFAVRVPEGNYNVIVYTGDEHGTSTITVRAECRRLMVSPMSTKNTEISKQKFTVHVRTPLIPNTGDSIRLKPRELNYLHWDDKLTLEFNGIAPKVCGVEIIKTDDPVTVFLAGNSTVVDQAEEPYAAWGQMIPAFFQPGKVVVANYAESGESLKAFRREKRWDKILSLVKPGDFIFIEFAHNDQKPGGNHLDAFTTYKEMLKLYIREARERNATPVLVTSMHRRNFDEEGRIVNTLGDYPEAVRQTGKEENVPVIDLHAMSKVLYEAWGPEGSLRAFVHFPAGTFPGQHETLKDNTHFTPYGAYQLAKCIVEGMRSEKLALVQYLKDMPSFNPASPDAVSDWYSVISQTKPDGN